MTYREKCLECQLVSNVVDEDELIHTLCPNNVFDPFKGNKLCSNAPTFKNCHACWNQEYQGEPISILYASKPEPPKIQDSGNRREFPTGAVRDICEGKGRCDLLPLCEVSRYVGDTMFESISLFQEHGDIEHLYDVLDGVCDHLGFRNVPDALLEVSKHFEDGCKKYGENNWRKGIPAHCYIDSAVRHYLKYLRGDKDERHDRAFVWNILCCIWTCANKPELNDYSRKEDARDDA